MYLERTESQQSADVMCARRDFARSLHAYTVQRQKEEETRVAIERWTTALTKDIAEYRKWVWRKRRRIAIRVVLVTALVVAQFTHQHFNFVWWWIFGGGAIIDKSAGSRQRTASELARVKDPRAVSVLAVACRDGDKDTRAVAEGGLLNILPVLQLSDAEHITKEGMEALIHLLSRRDVAMALAIMKALEQVGDARAIPVVTALRDRVENPDHVVAAAQQCLAALNARAELDRLRRTLLRPSEAPADPYATLLRPASAGAGTPEELLLRPVEEPIGG